MKKENLLIDCNIKAIRERLKTTLGNMQYQYQNMCSMPHESDIVQGYMFWDDMEKIQDCIYALRILEEEEKEIKRLEEQLKYQEGLGNKGRAEILKDYINKLKNKNK